MTMTLHYRWEDCPYQVLNSDASYRACEPIYHTYRGDVEYDYEVDVKLKDIIAYLRPKHFNTDEEKEMFKLGVTKLFDLLNNVDAIDFDQLEDDDFFREFMEERYEDEAYEEYIESFE